MAMRVPNPTIQARLCDIGTFPCERDLTFAVVSYDPERRTWTIGLWKALSGAEKPTTGPRLRWAIAEAILTNPAIAKAVERATGAADARPIFDRLLSLARSVDVRFNPHSRHWCAYAKPCTIDAKLWEEVRAAIRVISLRHNAGMLAFEPVQTARGNEPPWCQCCKNNDHVHFGCPFPLDNPSTYWGPAETSLSQIKTGILGRQPKKGGDTARGGNPKRGGNSRGGRGGGSQRGGGSNRGGPLWLGEMSTAGSKASGKGNRIVLVSEAITDFQEPERSAAIPILKPGEMKSASVRRKQKIWR
ncbi:hypothetical protein B0H14DRAFT_2579045 [Mycena olivaceomarginata]|nr:hypothetical protein B0H14DRAFT_2579045 [Mycena olivaceomarginata]